MGAAVVVVTVLALPIAYGGSVLHGERRHCVKPTRHCFTVGKRLCVRCHPPCSNPPSASHGSREPGRSTVRPSGGPFQPRCLSALCAACTAVPCRPGDMTSGGRTCSRARYRAREETVAAALPAAGWQH